MTDTPKYHVTKLYDQDGNVAPHFIDDEFHSFSPSWDVAMANPHFAALINREVEAEDFADKPLGYLERYAHYSH